MQKDIFKFKKFHIDQTDAGMKIGTDGILLGAWTRPTNEKYILDIGVGTGLITLMMAQLATEESKIHGVEIDEKSYLLAQKNVAASPWNERIKLFHTPVQDYLFQSKDRYDLIVSNPPFFSGGVLSESQGRARVRHTVKLPHGDLLRSVRGLLTDAGRFTLILPRIEGLRFIEMADSYGLHCSRKTRVFPHPFRSVERLLLEFTKDKAVEMDTTDFYIQKDETPNNYTDEFIDLTREFYLKL